MKVNEARVAKVLELLNDEGIGQMLVTDPMSIYYLTGAHVEPGERFLGLLLSADQRVMFVNDLFTLVDVEGAENVSFSDVDDIISIVAERLDAQHALGVDKNMAARFLVPLMERQAASAFVLGSFAVDRARSIKEPGEQDLMRAASAINDECIAEFAELVHAGVTELEIAEQLEAIYRAHGAEGFSFPPIVSFGANAADPHHMPDGTVLKEGEVVLFDVGCRKDGYCSDMSRTFFFGEQDEETYKMYDIVRAANEAAEAFIRPGVLFSEIDNAARSVIEEAGYGPYFMCRLGHQIGLDVHEPGDVSRVHHEQVEPGMVFSIEPGIYLPGRTGMRVEDLVLVTEDGCEVLNRYTHEAPTLTAGLA